MRFIADLSDWEKCRIVIPGGQSGHVASRHYADLIPLWLQGRFQPMPFQRRPWSVTVNGGLRCCRRGLGILWKRWLAK